MMEKMKAETDLVAQRQGPTPRLATPFLNPSFNDQGPSSGKGFFHAGLLGLLALGAGKLMGLWDPDDQVTWHLVTSSW